MSRPTAHSYPSYTRHTPFQEVDNIKDVKRYLNVTTIASNGLLVVKRNEPLVPTRECIIVPRQVLNGLLSTLHVHLSHPSTHQLKMVTQRYLFALDMDKAVDHVTTSCHHCASLSTVPTTVVKQSTNPPPETVGISFAADVIKRAKEFILVLRECVTSYTVSTLLPNERHETLRDTLISLCINCDHWAVRLLLYQLTPASCFIALDNDSVLHDHRIVLEIGRVKNRNKKPVVKRAVQELGLELLRQDPHGGPVFPAALSVATATLNSRIRSRGLSAREMWTQRDQFSNIQIPLSYYDLISQQQSPRKANHPSSENSKDPLAQVVSSPSVAIGDLVYLYCDRNKFRGRDRYLVTAIDGAWCWIRKFVGSQLRSIAYRIKKAECYKEPIDASPFLPYHMSSARFDTDDEHDTSLPPASPPQTPTAPPTPTRPLYRTTEDALPPPTPPPVPAALSTLPSHLDTDANLTSLPFPCNQTGQDVVPKRPTRTHRTPQYLEDFVSY